MGRLQQPLTHCTASSGLLASSPIKWSCCLKTQTRAAPCQLCSSHIWCCHLAFIHRPSSVHSATPTWSRRSSVLSTSTSRRSPRTSTCSTFCIMMPLTSSTWGQAVKDTQRFACMLLLLWCSAACWAGSMERWCWWQWRQLQPQGCCVCGCGYEGSMQLLLVPLLNFCCCCTDLALHRHHLGNLLGVVTAVLHLALDGGAVTASGETGTPQHACQCHSVPAPRPGNCTAAHAGLPCSMKEGAHPKELFRLFSGAVRARSANFSMNASRSRSKKAKGICRP